MAACGPELPDPVVTGVAPDRGWNGEATIVQITGANFYPQVQVAAGGGNSDLDATYSAWLSDPLSQDNEHKLNTVSVLDYGQLEGVVAEGLPSGVYDLRVVGPTGRMGLLEDAFLPSKGTPGHSKTRLKLVHVAITLCHILRLCRRHRIPQSHDVHVG